MGWVGTFLPLIAPNWFAPAFFVFLMRQFFMTIPKEYDDSAYIDGCSPLGMFWRIHLPLSLPAVGVVIIFQITFQWNDFLNPLIYLNKVQMYTVALGLRLFQGQMSNNMQGLMAASLMGILLTLLVFFFAQRYFVQGIVVTGVMGWANLQYCFWFGMIKGNPERLNSGREPSRVEGASQNHSREKDFEDDVFR